MARHVHGLIALMLWVGLVGAIQAVGIKETAKLTISGPGLRQPIAVIDAPVLALSNVFSGTFIGTIASEPDKALPRYVVTFDVQTREGVKTAAYVVTSCMNRRTREAFVYLPGRGDESYGRNGGTILRDGDDGRWHRASDGWSAALHARLPQR